MPMTRFCASDAKARSLVDLEFIVGEGPCSEAMTTNTMVACADLGEYRSPKWMPYVPQALNYGARCVSGFPVRIGVIRVGVLCLYRTEAGELNDEQYTDAFLMASVVGRGIVALQAGAEPQTLSAELQNEANFDFSVHQAAGMLAVQASVSISSALIALRMHAFASSQSLSQVSSRVVAR